MITILSNPKTLPSARVLGEAIGREGKSVIVTKYAEEVDPASYLVRYGNSTTVKNRKELGNSAEMIRICGDKQKTSEILMSHGIETPVFHSEMVPTDYPVLVRTTLTAFGGKGVFVAENMMEYTSLLTEGSVWTVWYNFSSEYRVHVVGNEVARIFKKIFTGEDEEEYPIRTNSRYKFSLRTGFESFKYMIKFVDSISSKLHLELVALDIGFCADSRRYVLIELNSAPGLNNNTADIYARRIVRNLET